MQDNHGNTKLYGEVRAAIEIQCVDCHGTAGETVPERIERTGRMATSGPASPPGGTNLLALRTPHSPRQPRFELRPTARSPTASRATSSSSARWSSPAREWEVKQTANTIRPDHPDYNAKSHAAKTVRWDDAGQLLWGGQPDPDERIDGHALRPSEPQHELHHLPLVVEPELLRLPPAAEGEPQGAEPAQRRRRLAEPRDVQLPDAPRRRLSCWPATAS